MYAWKCWHDSRDRVILYAAASLAIGLMFGAIALAQYHIFLSYAWEWSLRPRGWYWNPALLAWDWGLYLTEATLFRAALWVGLILGAVSVGREYRSGAMPFLLTRPASRKVFVWTDWSVGLAQMTAIVAMMLGGTVSVLCAVSTDYVWLSFPQLLECLLLGAVLYGLSHFTTALMGSSMKGLSASAAVILFYELLPGAFEDWWHLSGPLRFRDWSLKLWEDKPGVNDPFTLHGWPMLMWLLVALAFPLLSQFILEWREA
jgi:hypothetical protein